MIFCNISPQLPKPDKIFIAKPKKVYIISKVLGASSNGRTRDFGSLYHGSNPCAPTKNSTGFMPV